MTWLPFLQGCWYTAAMKRKEKRRKWNSQAASHGYLFYQFSRNKRPSKHQLSQRVHCFPSFCDKQAMSFLLLAFGRWEGLTAFDHRDAGYLSPSCFVTRRYISSGKFSGSANTLVVVLSFRMEFETTVK